MGTQVTMTSVQWSASGGVCDSELVSRVAWLLAMAAALLGFSVMAKQSYDDLQRSPIITYDSNPSSTRDVPPPAVSVCGAWIAPTGTRDLIDKLRANQSNEQERVDYMAALLLCGLYEDQDELNDFRNFNHVWHVFARLSGIIFRGKMPVGVYPYEEGYCLTFNMHGRGILTPEASWSEVLVQNGERLVTTDDDMLMVIQQKITETDKSCVSSEEEEETKYEVYAHDPGDFPGNDRIGGISLKQGAHARLEWFVKDAVEPLDEVASLPAARRKCFYPHDAPRLLAFKHYTPGNCLTDCQLTEDLKRYGCIQRFNRIYPVSHNFCDFDEDKPLPKGVISGEPCDCVELCSHVVYGLQLKWHSENIDLISTSVSVYRKIHTFTKKIRSVVITETGFLANCAGLLGLFLGVSVLSVFEVVYHVVVRVSGANTRHHVNCATSSELQQLKQLCSTLQQELLDIKSSQHLHQKTLDLQQKTLNLHQKKISRYEDDGLSNQDSSSINVPGNL